MASPLAVGIDLGTTNSCVAVFRNDQVVIVAHNEGKRTIPSYVAFTDAERVIGENAKSQGARNAQNTIFNVKRLIGRHFNDPSVQKDLKNLPFKVSEEEGHMKIHAKFKGEEKTFSPEQISGMVLGQLKETAESFLGQKVDKAVITVPAYFNDSQRQATADAGKIAGLEILGIISEPNAAALHYRLDKGYNNEKYILIYDLGGGTFDASVIAIDNVSKFEVKATVGNSHLGGEDFDNLLVDYAMDNFIKATKKDNARQDKKVLRRLRIACERAKTNLSECSKHTFEIDSLFEGEDFYNEMSRAKFEDLCHDLFQSTLDLVEKALSEAKLQKEQIDQIVLVGGSTKIPKLQKMLSEFFNGKDLNKTINPDEAVAEGAAIKAAILSGQVSAKLNDVKLLDVCPLSIGVASVGGITTNVIKGGTPIPTEASKLFTTFSDFQEAVDIEIYEGEETLTKDNHLLGLFRLSGLPPRPRGPRIEVTFKVDVNGILTASAQDKITGFQAKTTLDKKRLTSADIDRLALEQKKFSETDKEERDRLAARESLEQFILTLKRKVEKGDEIQASQKDTLKKTCADSQSWIQQNLQETKDVYVKKLKEIKESLSHIPEVQ